MPRKKLSAVTAGALSPALAFLCDLAHPYRDLGRT
jgi:hypothetical protein